MTAAHVGQAILDRFARLDVCGVSDAMDSFGIDGVIDGIRPLWEGARLVGRAVTMKLAEGPAPATATPMHLGARAIGIAGPGDVVVVDNGARDGMGSWGGLLTAAAARRGIVGVVTDGSCRDVDEVRELRFPVFGQSGAARTARGRVHEIECNTHISLGGVAVSPGDVVFADGSGVIVIPSAQVLPVLERAEGLAAREKRMLDALRSGTAPTSVLDGSYENALTEAGQR